MELKAALRRAARADRDALASGLGAAASTALVARFFTTPALRALISPSRLVAAYMPIGSEIDCRPLLDKIMAEGAPVCLPVVAGADKPLTFRRWSPGDPLVTGPMGIAEPPASAETVSPEVLLVPMLAFDRRGYRLGYGGGYYDRTLKALREGGEIVAVGVAFAGQVRDTVPITEDDQRLDWIVTETGAFCIADTSTHAGAST